MSVKSAIFNSLFTTGQKINIAVSRSLIDFYSNIRALAMLWVNLGVLGECDESEQQIWGMNAK